LENNLSFPSRTYNNARSSKETNVDVLQVFISTAAIFGIGLIWMKFNGNVFKMVRRLTSALFTVADDDNLENLKIFSINIAWLTRSS